MAKPEIQLIISAVLKDKALVEAVAKTKDLEKQVASLKDRLKGGSDAAKAFSGELAKWVSVGAAFAFLKNTATEFANFERSANALSDTFRRMGMEPTAAIARVTEFLEGLAATTGFIDDDTLPAFTRFLTLTKSFEGAMAGTSLAVDIAAKRNIALSDAATLLQKAMEGGTKALVELGIAKENDNGKTLTATEITKLLIQQYGGFSKKVDDGKRAVGSMSVAWDAFSDAIGKRLQPALQWIARGLTGVTAILTLLPPYAEKARIYLVALIEGYYNSLKTLANPLNWADPAKMKAALVDNIQKALDARNVEIHRADVALAEANRQVGVMLGEKKIEGEAEAYTKGLKALLRVSAAADADSAQKEADQREQKWTAFWHRIYAMNDEAAKASTQAWAKAASEHAKRFEEGSRRWLSAEIAAIEADRRAKIQAAKGTAAELLAINVEASSRVMEAWSKVLTKEAQDRFKQMGIELDNDLQVVQIKRDLRLDEIEWEMDKLTQFGEWTTSKQIDEYRTLIAERKSLRDEELDLEAEAEIARTGATGLAAQAIRNRYSAAKMRNAQQAAHALDNLDKWQQMNALERAKSVAGTIQAINVAFFGNNKRIAIAATIINTIAAAVEALKNGGGVPWGLIPFALTLATGYAQVQAIRSQDMAEGGMAIGTSMVRVAETPRARPELILPLRAAKTEDLLAGAMSRAARRIVGSPAAAAAAAGSVTNVNITEEYHLHSAVADDRTLRDLSRKLDVAKRRDASRFLR